MKRAIALLIFSKLMLSNFARLRIALAASLLTVSLTTACATESAETAPSSAPPQPTAAPAPSAPSPATEPPPPDAVPPATTTADPLTVTDAPRPLTQAEIWQRLQQPGDTLYVVLLRHALAPGTGDPANFQLDDCSTQRNLDEAGREQARQIGQAFRDRGVPVQQVLSSQWCRCLETAELMDLGEVEPYPPLNSFFQDRSTADAQTTETKQFLATQANNPGVIVMVTHQVNITGVTGIVPRSGEAVLLQVEADGLTQIGQFMPAS